MEIPGAWRRWWERASDPEVGVFEHAHILTTRSHTSWDEAMDLDHQTRILRVARIYMEMEEELKRYNNLIETMVKLWSAPK